jgi:ankyrin repeat protein
MIAAEIIYLIVEYLDYADIFNLMVTNKYHHHILNPRTNGYIWKLLLTIKPISFDNLIIKGCPNILQHCAHQPLQFSHLQSASKSNNLSMIKHLYFNCQLVFEKKYTYTVFDNFVLNNNVPAIHFLLSIHHRGSTKSMDHAACNGYGEMVKLLHRNSIYGTTDAVDLAAKSGHLSIIKYLHENYIGRGSDKAGVYACMKGDLAIVTYLHKVVSMPFGVSEFKIACQYNHLELVKYFHLVLAVRDENLMDIACHYGCGEIVKFLHVNGYECTDYAFNWAAGCGHLDIVKFLHTLEPKLKVVIPQALDFAAMQNNLPLIRYLVIQCNVPCTFDAIDNACKYGNFDVAKFLLDQHKPFSHRTISFIVSHGNIEMLRYLLGVHPEITLDTSLIDVACDSNQMEMLEYIHPMISSNKYNHRAMTSAATKGNILMVQFLDSINAPTTYNAMNSACKHGHSHIVEYLIVNDKPYSSEAATFASEHGHLIILQLLFTHHKEFVEEAVDMAAANGHDDVVKYLIGIGLVGTTNAFDWACQYNHLDIVKYLWSRGLRGTTSAMDVVGFNGNLLMIKYLHEIGMECSGHCFDWACTNGHLDVVDFLLEIHRYGSHYITNDVILYGHLDMLRYLIGRKYPLSLGATKIARDNDCKHIVAFLESYHYSSKTPI